MKISIVTVCYNSKDFIRQTIESVALQDYSDIEHVVIDGGSTDGTVQILQEFKDKITYISEPDKGIYDAMNKGVKLASGEVIGTLGAGDFYPNNQVISIYYTVKPKHSFEPSQSGFKISHKPFDFEVKKEGAQTMRWVELDKISENDFTFIIDKRIGEMLNNSWKQLF